MPAKKNVESSVQEVRERAYFLWEEQGRPAGRDLEFWSRAADMLAAAAPEMVKRRKAAPAKTAAKPAGRVRSAA